MRVLRALSYIQALFGGASNTQLVLKGAGVVFAIQLIGAALSFFSFILLARWLGVEQYGVYAFYLSLSTLLALAAGVGLPISTVRFSAQYREQKDYSRLRGFFDFSRWLTLNTGAAIAGMLALIVYIFDLFHAQAHIGTTMIAFAVIPIIALSTLYSETARAFLWPGLAESPLRIIRPSIVIIAIGSMVGLGFRPDAFDAYAAFGCGVITALIFIHILIRSRISPQIRNVEPIKEIPHWISVSLPMLMIRGSSVLRTELNIVLVGLFLGVEITATYQAAARTSLLVSMIFSSAMTLGAPRFAALHATGKREELRELLRMLAHFIFWPTLAVSMLLIAIGQFVLGLFGEEFIAGLPVLAILISSFIYVGATGPVAALLNMTGHQNACARVFAISIIISVFLLVTLIPNFGAVGAALAVLITDMISRTWLLGIVLKKLDLNPSILPDRWLVRAKLLSESASVV